MLDHDASIPVGRISNPSEPTPAPSLPTQEGTPGQFALSPARTARAAAVAARLNRQPRPQREFRLTPASRPASVSTGSRMTELLRRLEWLELTCRAEAKVDSDSPADRRAFPRRDSGCVVSVWRRRDDRPVSRQQVEWLLHSTPLKGRMIDISMNGVAFLLSEPLEAGETLELRLANPRLDLRIDVAAAVLRSQESAPGEWKIICRFLHCLTLDQMHAFSRQLFPSPLV